MYFFEALQYPFNSQGWIGKAAIGVVLMIIPIFGWFTLGGYVLRLTREILNGNMELPDYDYGADFGRGLSLFVAALIYQIPAFIIGFVLGALLGNGIVSRILVWAIGYLIGLILQVAIVRYVLTEDFSVFWDLGRNFALIRDNIGAVVTYIINTILFGIVAGIILTIGFMLLVIPGLILTPLICYASAYLLARYAQELGLSVGKSKEKNYA
jgi:hypothetical protein